jgi:hypothetical protein
MFRTTTKKKPKPRTIRASAEVDEDNDEDTLSAPPTKILRKPNRTVVRSLEVEGGGKKKKRRTTGGLGFGGAPSSSKGEEKETGDSETAISKQNDLDQSTTASVSYGKDALSKLKSEQKFKARATEDEEKGVAVSAKVKDNGELGNSLPAYIPLDGKEQPSDEPTILTGEEAMSFNQKGTSPSIAEDLEEDVEMTHPYSNENEESSEWEAEVTRRAGIHQSAGNSTSSTFSSPPPRKVSIAHLRANISSTIALLQKQREDLERALHLREAEALQTKLELQHQEGDLDQSGRALEYYQGLRETLASWVGALRELNGKVMPIQEALHELESEIAASDRWRDWENDTISVLHRAGQLDQVLGRQPPSTIFDKITTVDEFGRDIKSQHAMHREKRFRHRQLIQQQRRETVRGDESDALVSDEEQEGFRERHVSLQRALQVAIDDLDDSYTKLQNLVAVFEEWYKMNPEEYRQCFASLSLGDLASVLVQADLCSLNDPWNESEGYNEAKWIAVAHGAGGTEALHQTGVVRIVEKAVIPALTDLFARSGYNLISTRQARSLSAFYLHIQTLFPENSAILLELRQQITKYMQGQLQDISVAILFNPPLVLPSVPAAPATATAVVGEGAEELREAIHAATVSQMHRLDRIARNLLTHWSPILGVDDEFIGMVLDFISNKFLFLLSSLHGGSGGGGVSGGGIEQASQFEATPADVFGGVWDAVKATGWLERPEWMIQAAPICAAAIAYGIN